MALMYPWATKEYLLWEMTIGQIILYHNMGVEMKFGAPKDDGVVGYADMSPEQVRKIRDEYREKYGAIDDGT